MGFDVLTNRILVKPIDLETEHEVEGTGIKIAISRGKDENRHRAGRVEGTVVGIGPLAYGDIGDGTCPLKVGDFVVFAKYAGVFLTDPDTNEDVVVLNDEDVLVRVIKGDKK